MNGQPSDQFLNELRNLWSHNFPAAILQARLYHYRIPLRVVDMVGGMQQAFRVQRDIGETVAAALGTMGIFGGPRPGPGIDPDEFMFYGAMALVVTNRGDPPAAPALQADAKNILAGTVDPLRAFEVGIGQVPGFPGVWQALTLTPIFAEVAPLLRRWGFFMAALALPRTEIPAVLGIRAPSVENEFDKAIKQTMAALQSGQKEQAEQHLIAALDAAARTPAIDDDLQVVGFIVLMSNLPGQPQLEWPDLVRRAARRLTSVAIDDKSAAKVGPLLGLCMTAVLRYGLVEELGVDLVRTSRSLEEKIKTTDRLSLALTTSRTLLGLSQVAEAEALMARVKDWFTGPEDSLKIAGVEADIATAKADAETAVETLINALDENEAVNSEIRLQAVQKLIGLWPEHRSGLSDWIDELEAITGGLEEPQGTLTKIWTATAVLRAGRGEQARLILRSVDLETFEHKAPESQRELIREVREALRRRSPRRHS